MQGGTPDPSFCPKPSPGKATSLSGLTFRECSGRQRVGRYRETPVAESSTDRPCSDSVQEVPGRRGDVVRSGNNCAQGKIRSGITPRAVHRRVPDQSRTESWADFREDLRILADRAYPDLQEEVCERLPLNRYLDQLITDPQIAFAVRQTLPKSVDGAVTATLRLESYQIRPAKPVGLVQETRELSPQLPVEAVVGAVGGRPRENSTATLIQSLVERIERLETDKRHSTEEQRLQDRRTEGEQRKKYRGRPGEERQKRGTGDEGRAPVICHRCGKEGHYARGCAARRAMGSGNI